MRLSEVERELRATPRCWLVTGSAGFIGSNLVERLLALGQEVVGLDNLSTGQRKNVEGLAHPRYTFLEGDVREPSDCARAVLGVDFVLHQAALGSVPRSIKDPLGSHLSNVDGTLNMLVAARDAKVKRFVYASSSSVYGDHPALPKVEDQLGKPLSPYAATKRMGELYAQVFADSYGLECIGLRYFNVFGRRQDSEGPYAAVVPRWVAALLSGRPCVIYGDGKTSRDFCYVDNVLQANILAATAAPGSEAVNRVYNIACGDQTTLVELYFLIRDALAKKDPKVAGLEPSFEPFRPGDIRHSLADVGLARRLLGYAPTHTAAQGLAEAMDWYWANARA